MGAQGYKKISLFLVLNKNKEWRLSWPGNTEGASTKKGVFLKILIEIKFTYHTIHLLEVYN